MQGKVQASSMSLTSQTGKGYETQVRASERFLPGEGSVMVTVDWPQAMAPCCCNVHSLLLRHAVPGSSDRATKQQPQTHGRVLPVSECKVKLAGNRSGHQDCCEIQRGRGLAWEQPWLGRRGLLAEKNNDGLQRDTQSVQKALAGEAHTRVPHPQSIIISKAFQHCFYYSLL